MIGLSIYQTSIIKKETDQFLIDSKTARYDVLIAWKLLPDFLLQLFYEKNFLKIIAIYIGGYMQAVLL